MTDIIIREADALPDERSADEIARSINQIKAEVQEAVLTGAIRIGRELKAAKSRVPYGEWGVWLQTHVNYSERTAQNLMRIADEYGRRSSEAMEGLSITQATALLGLTAEQREAFVETHDMASMTTDQLQAEVRKLKEELRGSQQTIEQLLKQANAESSDYGQIAELEKMLEEAEQRAKAAEAAAAEARTGAEMDDKAKQQAKEALELANREATKARQEKAQLETKLQAYKQRAEAAERQKERTEEALLEERAKPAKVEYRTPPEVEQELARLRAAAGQSEAAGMVRKLMEDLSSICQRLGYQLTAAAAENPETGGKLRRAAAQALHKQAEALER